MVQDQTCNLVVMRWALYRISLIRLSRVGTKKEMDFGISLDPASVTQRHCFEDSDEDEDESARNETEQFITPENQSAGLAPEANLIIAMGQPASIFARSYLSLDPLPSCRISAHSHTVFKDRYFSSRGHTHNVVSEGFDVKCKGSEIEKFHLCIHENQLNSQHCNSWCTKVIMCVEYYV